jgi:uncharacterized repeat protein (TIGR01451 family)
LPVSARARETFDAAKNFVLRQRHSLPALCVAALAVMLQIAAVIFGPLLTPSGVSKLAPGPTTLDYSAEPSLAIPRLTETFVLEAIGRAPGTSGSSVPTAAVPTVVPVSYPHRSARTEPEPTPEATPAPAPLIAGTGEMLVSISADRTTVYPDDLLTYVVAVTNTGDDPVTTAFVTNVHVPQFTFWCTQGGEACAYPGDYDGSSMDSGDLHAFPVQTESTRTVPAHSTLMLRKLVVRVFPSVPAGTLLYDHTHVDIVGDGKSAITRVAPIVSVQER